MDEVSHQQLWLGVLTANQTHPLASLFLGQYIHQVHMIAKIKGPSKATGLCNAVLI